ncbi:MAG: CHASE2 domain-containing protein [Stenomitos rutilans HA7619-LM2]|jgi:CHASE2 domain-containing sensor protein|nr:CHASE2 domain-containing protein [Stenomitos rutilans HA7619-LM2]
MELFELYLAPGEAANQFKVTVSQSSVGEGSVESLLPFFEGEHDWRTTLLKTMESTAFDPDNFQIPNEQAWMVHAGLLSNDRQTLHPTRLKTIGRSLYQALFPQDSVVKQRLQSALSFAESKDIRLHIRLKFDANSTPRSRLADYPWELIHDGQRFLAQHQVTFSRYIAHDTVPPNLPATKQITVLLVSSSASDVAQGLKPISTTEQQAIQQGLEKATQTGDIRLVQLERSTLRHLRAYLTEQTGDAYPQVLHFDGHGLFGKRCVNEQCRAIHKGIKVERCRICGTALPDAQGYLVFEQEDGKPDYVSAAALGALLQQTSFADGTRSSNRIALTVLSACQSGMSVVGDSLFNGMAQNLISHRVPAVVAMQYSVSVQSAAQFAEQFYRSLGQKNALAIAVSQGREAMGAEGNQWYRPVLYLRWRDNGGGQLFAITHPSDVFSPTTKASKPIEQAVGWLGRSWYRCVSIVSLGVTSIVFGLRLQGNLQPYELAAFDRLLNIRINDQPDDRLLIVEINKNDVKRWGGGQTKERATLSDDVITKLLQTLDRYEPKAIGLDVYRPFAAEPNSELERRLRTDQKIVSVCKASDQSDYEADAYAPPPELPLERQGFSDFIYLEDGGANGGVIRRYLFAMKPDATSPCKAGFAFSFQLAMKYLSVEPELTDEGYKLGDTLFTPMNYPAGGYWNFDDRGHQVLLDYRAPEGSVRKIATTKTLTEILEEKGINEDLKRRIIMVAVTDPEFRDYWHTPLSDNPVPGIIIHAQMVGQILRVVEDKQRMIWYLPSAAELLWVVGWTVGSSLLVWKSYRFLLFALSLATVSSILVASCTLAFVLLRLWLPLIPTLFVLIPTGSFVFLVKFYADKSFTESDTEGRV